MPENDWGIKPNYRPRRLFLKIFSLTNTPIANSLITAVGIGVTESPCSRACRWGGCVGNALNESSKKMMLPSRRLTANDYKTLWLATLGSSLEVYDSVIFVFFANIIGDLFFPPEIPAWVRQFQTFGIFAAGYLARPVGGIIMAHTGDLRGRKQMFTLGIFLMGLSTLCIGLLPTYHNVGIWAPVLLLVLRILQGMAFGGEVPGALVFVSEHVPSSRVGLALGILTGGLTGGILLGSLVATGLHVLISPAQSAAYGWRIAFLLGGAFGLLAVYLRGLLTETPVFLELKERRALAAEMPLRVVVRNHGAGVIFSGLLTWMLSAAIVVIILMTPALVEKMYNVPVLAALQANSLATAGMIMGGVFMGWLTDRFGPGPVLLTGSLLLGIGAYLLYIGVKLNPSLIMPLYLLAGLSAGVGSVVAVIMIAAFPPAVRFSGVSLSYNLANAIFGGLSPIIVTWWMRFDQLAPAHYMGIVCLLSFGIGILLRGPLQNQLIPYRGSDHADRMRFNVSNSKSFPEAE